jgi:hypothetical protein
LIGDREAAWLAESGQETVAVGGEDFGGGALREDAAVVEADDVGVEEKGFVDVVGDGEDRDVVVAGPVLHGGQELVAEGQVEAGEGFVEEQETGAGCGEGAGERDALGFSAGEAVGEAFGEGVEMEEIDGVFDEGKAEERLGVDLEGEADVFADGEVREEGGVLRGVSEGAFVRRLGGEVCDGGLEALDF